MVRSKPALSCIASPVLGLGICLVGCGSDDPGITATDGPETDGIATLATTGASTADPFLSTGYETSDYDPTHPDGKPETTSGGTGEDSFGETTDGTPDPTATGGTPCDEGDPLCEIPPEEQVPTDKPDGLPGPIDGVYDDQGPAPPDQGVRALLGLPTRDRAVLEDRVEQIYDPGSPEFMQYMTAADWMAAHAPSADDYALIKAWLASRDLHVDFESTNRLLVQFSGTVADFNATFQTELHVCLRKNPQAGLPPFPVYCTLESFTLPKFIADRTNGLVTADLPAATGKLAGESGAVMYDPPGPSGFSPAEIAGVYGVQPLYADGFTGQGATIGVVGAATFHIKDLQTFYKSFKVARALPTAIDVMEPSVTRITETMLDVTWASSLAPGAAVRVYQGPDARNTALLFAFNEAIARAEIDVLTTSFAHREDSEPKPLRHQYDESALMAAALGITVVSASGDSGQPDIPCTSPYVTCVGGTSLVTDGDGELLDEDAWEESGSGDAKTFKRPYWQADVAPNDRRATCDLALNADPESPYWLRRFGQWTLLGGTSFSAPVFAGMVAVINSARAAQGKPRVGFMNPALYLDEGVRASFRDITGGGTNFHDAGPGWDYPTGWGAPDVEALAQVLP